jgi:hypothetical protein
LNLLRNDIWNRHAPFQCAIELTRETGVIRR